MRTESGLGFEATIAPNTTSTLAAEGSDQDGVGHYTPPLPIYYPVLISWLQRLREGDNQVTKGVVGHGKGGAIFTEGFRPDFAENLV